MTIYKCNNNDIKNRNIKNSYYDNDDNDNNDKNNNNYHYKMNISKHIFSTKNRFSF